MNTKHRLDAEDAAALGRVGKRTKVHSRTPSKNASERKSVELSKRISRRQRKPVPRPERATEDQVNEVISSPTPSASQKAEMHTRRKDRLETKRPASIMGSDESQSTLVVNSVEQGFPQNQPSSRPVEPDIHMKGVHPSDVDQAVQTSDAPAFHFGHLPTPSSVSEVPKEIRHQSEGARSRVSVEFVYRVILSRTPVYLCKGWYPKGKFQDKTLRELLTELPLEGTINGLTFTLEGPGFHIEQQIDGEDENRFEIMKRHFNKQIRACVVNCAQSKTPLLIEMEIEPLRGESVQGNDEIDDADFDW